MNTKEIVDKYLLENFREIQDQKEINKDFRWVNVAEVIAKKHGNLFYGTCKNCNVKKEDGEYIRGRWRKLQNKIDSIQIKDVKLPIAGKVYQSSTTNEKFKYVSGKENKKEGTKEFVFNSNHIPTEQEIIEHFNIDTTKFRINQIYHKTSFGGKYAITVSLLALKGIESKNYEEKFEKFVEKYNNTILINPSKDTRIQKNNEDFEKCAYLISLADLHIGNYQRPDYLSIIKDTVFYVFENAKDFNIDEVILLNTGDMLHTDTSKAQTWNNTQLDAQDSFEDAFTDALDLITALIDYARTLGLKLTFINVRGNHSFDTEYCLGEAIRRVYKSDEKIKVLNSKDTRIYYEWNNNGFLFTHGDKGLDRLPLMFATEGKEVFTNTEHHHIILGHLHHNKGKQFVNDRGEFAGIEVRVLGSPTSNDIWHKQNAFCQNKKSIQCMLFTAKQGKYGEFNFKM